MQSIIQSLRATKLVTSSHATVKTTTTLLSTSNRYGILSVVDEVVSRLCFVTRGPPTPSLSHSCPQLEHNAGKRTRTLESRLGIPERPKKPLSPYFRFMSEVRPTVVAAHPTLRLQDVVKAIAVKWETVDEARKNQYVEAYKTDQIAFLKKRAAYEASLTDDQRFGLKDLKEQIAQNKERLLERKRVRALGRPKRAMSPYLCWLNDPKHRLERLDGEKFVEWQRRGAAIWKTLSDEAKKPFYDRSSAAFNKYSDELLQWEEKMVRQGNVDVVRNIMLVDPVEKKTKLRQKKVVKLTAASVLDDTEFEAPHKK